MKKWIRWSLLLLFSAHMVVLPSFRSAQAAPMKEFITLTTYGVLAGTLVGTASLAFTDQPGENLQLVARGASLGLYAGILLGIYVVYVVPGKEEELIEEGLDVNSPYVPRSVTPIVSKKGVEGVYAQWQIYSFN